MNKIAKMKECPECGSLDIIYNKTENELICKDCGLIYTEFIETIPLEEKRPIKKMVSSFKKKHEEIKPKVMNKTFNIKKAEPKIVKKPVKKAIAKPAAKVIAKPVKKIAVKQPAKKIVAKAKPTVKTAAKSSNNEKTRNAISSILGRFRR